MMLGEFVAEHAWQLAMLVVLVLSSGFFSGTETALFSLSRGQLYRLRHSCTAGAAIGSLMSKPRRVLNTLLMGNMLVNVAFATISAVMILRLEAGGAPGWAVGLASAAPLVVLILVGEVTPKMLAFVSPERWAAVAARPLAIIGQGLGPLLWVVERAVVQPLTRAAGPRGENADNISADELGALMDLSAKRGIITHDANALLQEILELTDLRVGEIMVPRVDVIAYDVDETPAGLIELFRKTHLRKIPVYEGSIDNILGVVHARRLLLNPSAPLREFLTAVPFVPEAGNVERVLLQLRLKRVQMAIVVDEYGGTAGLVTLEDVLEEIVGDIPDPRQIEEGPAVEQTADKTYLLDGDLGIHEWTDAFNMNLASRRISTIGGFVTSLLGRIGAAGDEITYRNLKFTIESMRRRRIGKLRLELLEETP